MTTRRVSFRSAQGHELRARLEVAEGGAPRAHAVFAHCFTCSKDYKAPVFVSRRLAAHGISTLRFDFTGLGESRGDFSRTGFSTNVSDIVSAARFLAEEHGAPAILVGHSMGGAAALMAAAEIGSVGLVATIAAPAEAGHVAETLQEARRRALRDGAAEVVIGGRRFTLARSFFEDLAASRVRETLASLEAAFLFFHSPADTVVPADSARALFMSARHPKSFVALPGADHLLGDERDAAFVGDVIAAWARRYVFA